MEATLVIHRGGPHQCRDVSRPGPIPRVGDRVVLDDADFYNAIARVVKTDAKGRVWIYCDRWDQVLDDRDLLWEGWQHCELPDEFAKAVYRYRLEQTVDRIEDAADRYIALCVDADPDESDIARQGCENMRESLHRSLAELISLSSRPTEP